MDGWRWALPRMRPYLGKILLSLLFLSLVVAADLLIPRQIEYIIDVGIGQSDMSVVVRSGLLMVGLLILSMCLTLLNIIYAVQVSEYFAADIRAAAYRQTQKFSFANLDKLQTSELLVRLTSDITLIRTAMLLVLRIFFRAPLMLTGALIMLILTSPTLALMLVVLLPTTVGLIFLFSRRSEPMFKAVQGQLDRVNMVLQENIAGVRVVRAFVRADYENQRFDRANQELYGRSVAVNQLIALLLPCLILVLNVGIIGIVWFGGSLAINGLFTTGQIVAFSNYLLMTMFPVLMLGMVLPQVYSAEASLGRIREIMDTESDIQDQPDAQTLPLTGAAARVAFENVSLYYNHVEDQNTPVLQNVSFVAEPGETVAILGPTGSGKSSLVNLIPRLYDVSEGRVTVDGIDVRDLSQASLRAQIGMALQEAVLFSGTVRENIAFGRPEASEEEIIAAAKAAQAHDFIMSKPEGYDTEVSQRGTNFSGGQKQRIAIARALCVQPRILVLDDSTSALDVETEAALQNALAELITNCTSIIVAQRVSTVLTADKIVVLEGGRVAAVGTHTELLESSPIYQEVYESQLGGGLVKTPSSANGHVPSDNAPETRESYPVEVQS